MRKTIQTDKAPKPAGPYSQAVVAGGLVFVAGQVPINPATGSYEPAEVSAETRRVMDNLKAIVEASGSSMDKVVQVRIYLRDMKDFAATNEVYATYFSAPPPARTTTQAGALPLGCSVIMDCVAAV